MSTLSRIDAIIRSQKVRPGFNNIKINSQFVEAFGCGPNGEIFAAVRVKTSSLFEKDFIESLDILEGEIFIDFKDWAKMTSSKVIALKLELNQIAASLICGRKEIYSFQVSENKFPDIDTVVRKQFADKAINAIALDPLWLPDIAKALYPAGSKVKNIVFGFDTDKSAITIKAAMENDIKGFAILMPCLMPTYVNFPF